MITIQLNRHADGGRYFSKEEGERLLAHFRETAPTIAGDLERQRPAIASEILLHNRTVAKWLGTCLLLLVDRELRERFEKAINDTVHFEGGDQIYCLDDFGFWGSPHAEILDLFPPYELVPPSVLPNAPELPGWYRRILEDALYEMLYADGV